ncbi:MAG: methyltransferase domain-containing protein [Proteobacteria bacterium]|nr:methyltransferase domain-containing protein [Pseudomonadota bacterium]
MRLVSQDTRGPILDAGCGTGHGTHLLGRCWPGADILALDFALPMVAAVVDTGQRLCADMESLPLASSSMGGYWSNLAMQWCDSRRVAGEAARVLRPGGWLAVSTLGPGTFAELRQAFAGVDAHRHTLVFPARQAVAAAFTGVGLRITLEQRSLLRHYPDLGSLLAAVRELGASRVTGAGRRTGLMGKVAWQRFAANYEALRQPRGLPLSYDVFFILGQR